MSEIKEIIKKKDETATVVEPVKKAEDTIITPTEKSDVETKQLREQLEETNFKLEFKDVVEQYPHAAEFKDKIRDKVKAGYSLEDAAVSVLKKENKLMTADEIDEAATRGNGFGGSSTVVATEKAVKSLDDLRKEFQEAEARGEIKLT